jgi:hypothetical protein
MKNQKIIKIKLHKGQKIKALKNLLAFFLLCGVVYNSLSIIYIYFNYIYFLDKMIVHLMLLNLGTFLLLYLRKCKQNLIIESYKAGLISANEAKFYLLTPGGMIK